MKSLFYICFAPVFLFSLHAQQTEHVVVVVIDGARYTETFGDSTHTNIPFLWNQLRPIGTVYTSFWNEGVTVTNPGHASILTGTWQTISNDGLQRPTVPTLFEYFRKEKNEDSLSCWVALGKSKLDILSGSTHPEYGMEYSASIRTSNDEYNDVIACENACYVLQTYHPRLTIVNFPRTDNRGHAGNWQEYISAIQTADSLIALMWNFIQEDSLLQNSTTMIITNDHGRHTTDFTGHGDDCEGCRHIMMLCIGPDTPAGVVDTMMHRQVDIAPTIGALMGLSTSYSIGTTLSSAVGTHVLEPAPLTPQKYFLYQNYPNPFNPKTTIRYQLFEKSCVTLKVYDIFGREVSTLVHGIQTANMYTVPFEVPNLSSGVYFYMLQAGSQSVSRKMMVLK